ncbi:spore germination protein [Paenibacillus luteus]|uniref:spore germination protein n=1 Tax=Paenibacillus luteus TaxID=2545753 RepID=UPI001144D151
MVPQLVLLAPWLLENQQLKQGLYHHPSVIVVAGTAIASFTIPSISLSATIRLLRFVMIILASFLGLYGIMIGLFLLGIHLSSIKSVGMPYLVPFAPYKPTEKLTTMERSLYKREI